MNVEKVLSKAAGGASWHGGGGGDGIAERK